MQDYERVSSFAGPCFGWLSSLSDLAARVLVWGMCIRRKGPEITAALEKYGYGRGEVAEILKDRQGMLPKTICESRQIFDRAAAYRYVIQRMEGNKYRC
jgi:hypothetical protein